MGETRWRGNWWRPDKSDDRQPGMLLHADDGSLRLELIGGFGYTEWRRTEYGMTGSPGDPRFPILLGQCGNEPFTLLDSIASNTRTVSLFPDDVSEQTLTVMRGLRGIHLAGADEPIFDAAHLELEYLLGWVGQTTMHGERVLEKGRWTGEQTVRTKPIEDLAATYGDVIFTLSMPFTNFRFDLEPQTGRRVTSGREWAELELAFAKPVSLDEFNRLTTALADLMTLCAHAPAGALKRTFRYTASDAHPVAADTGTAALMSQQVHQPGRSTRGPALVEYLFTLKDVAFDVVVPVWMELYERAEAALHPLFGLKYSSQGYVQHRLLSAASAAEALHRSLHARRSKLSYRNRLLRLAAIPDAEAVQTLVPDIEQWAGQLVRARNVVAHADGVPTDHAELVRWAGLCHALAGVTYALISIVLLAELGLPAEVQRRAATNQDFMVAAENYAEALAAGPK
jgi:ApeA-like protein/HEPN superfamily Apea-like protein